MSVVNLALRRLATAIVIATASLMAPMAHAADLIMIDRAGCAYCIAWKEQIGPAYPNTDLGRFAPLQIVDIGAGAPDGVTFDRPVVFTPTFILIEEGTEIGRIEGYPGEEFFWFVLENLLKNKTDFASQS